MKKPDTQILDMETWNNWKCDFPATGSDEDKLRYLIRYAVLAPSSHNAQPWVWEVRSDRVDLYADTKRALPVADPMGRELIVGCGAALEHLRIAMQHFGYAGEVHAFPSPRDPDLLARIPLGEHVALESANEVLFEAIPHRHTNRHLFRDEPLPHLLVESLCGEAARTGAWLHIAQSPTQRTGLIELIARGDVMQWHDREFRHEHARWMRANSSKRGDGIPGCAMGISDVASHLSPVAMRVLNMGEEQADKDWLLAGSAPALAILGTDSGDLRDWLASGQSLARVLLRASAAGVSASFFNQPIEIHTLNNSLHNIIGRYGFSQLMFRLGYPTDAALATPRRDTEEVVTSNIALHNIAKYFRTS